MAEPSLNGGFRKWARPASILLLALALALGANLVLRPGTRTSWVTVNVVPLGLMSAEDARRVAGPNDSMVGTPHLLLCFKQGLTGGPEPYYCPGPAWVWVIRYRNGAELTVDAHSGAREGGINRNYSGAMP